VSRLQEAAERCRRWLVQDALPLWGSAGREPDGAFHERLLFDGRPDLGSVRRMRVQARQLYVFSEAAARGWRPEARAVADAGFSALVRDCWARDGRPGFLHTLAPDKSPLDLKRDAYDHAFGLFALAWYYKASGEPRALSLAHKVLDVLERDLADPAGGFVENVPDPVLPRRSDPHMHLLEACLEWSEAGGGDRFLDMAARMVALFRTRFFDRDTGTLYEFFAADLSPAPGPPGQIVAPGHHFEWCWLLAWAEGRGVGDARPEADALYGYGLRHGLDAQGLAVDECDRQGRQVRASRRLWPQTELIKGHLTKARQGLVGASEAAADVALKVLDSYLATDVPGLWMDQFDASGRGMTDAAPASSLYHVVVAFRELMVFAEGVS
jgi:mannose/cellobiose epimerase-like protein (N-acyl-D-glucosamine 2-epimerase family)